MRNQHFISFGITYEEKEECLKYIKRKRRWKSLSDFARDAFWQHMARNPVYRKRAEKKAKNG